MLVKLNFEGEISMSKFLDLLQQLNRTNDLMTYRTKTVKILAKPKTNINF